MIKNLLLAFTGLTLASASFAQQGVPNGGFNSWTGIRPNSWVTVNEITMFGNDTSAYKDVTSFVEGGASLRLETVKLNNNPFAAYGIPDTVGIAFTGVINIVGPSLITGFPYAARPAELVFAQKYTPAGADTAWATVVLQKWNNTTNMHDTIATGMWGTANTTTSFAYASIPLVYNPLMMNAYPDTAIILFSSSSYTTPKIGSMLWVDNVAWNGWTGVNEISEEAAKVYPNPADESVNFAVTAPAAAYVQIYDAAGRKITEASVWNRRAELSARSYPEGVYFYSVVNDKREVIGRGKFSISH